MIRQLRHPHLVCAVAGAWAALAGVWWVRQGVELKKLHRPAAARRIDDGGFQTIAGVAMPAPPRWREPDPPSDDPTGVADLFTPPTLFRDARTGRLSTTPPQPAGLEPDHAGFGLELVAVWREPFRLQLVGYVGETGSHLGIFERTDTGAIRLARGGGPFDDLELQLLRFEVRREMDAAPGRTPLTGRVAVAEVLDRRTGEVVSLSSRRRRETGPLRGRVRVTATGETHDLAVGARLSAAGADYRLVALHESPPAAEVSRVVAGVAAESRHLTVP